MSIIKDDTDRLIVKTASDKNGVRLSELARIIGMSAQGTRLRVLELERLGAIKIERGHQKVVVFAIEETY